MGNEYDPYREALVLETETFWPEELANVPPERRQEIESQLHSDPAEASELTYLRTHTGFTRQISVSSGDLERLGGAG